MKKFIIVSQLLFAFAIAEFQKKPELQSRIDSLEQKFEQLAEKTESLQITSTEQEKHIKQLELELGEAKSSSSKNNSTLYIRRKSVCPGYEVTLSCPEGQTLLLQHAEYGKYSRHCGKECCTPNPLDCIESMESNNADEWMLLKLRCDNKTTCSYTFQGSTFMETCTAPDPVNYLSIYYSCQPDVARLVGFTAYSKKDRAANTDAILLFDQLLTNLGDFYDPTTSVFICPVSGIYMFSVNILTWVDHHVKMSLMLNNGSLASTYATKLSDSQQVGSVFVIAECGVGSKLWVRCTEHDSELRGSSDKHSTFSGYLLHEHS